MKVCVLASGSKANSIWIEDGYTACVVDNGLSLRQFKLRVEEANLNLNILSAIFVTHEHTDHISGVSDLASHLNINVYTGKLSEGRSLAEFGHLKHTVISHNDVVEHGSMFFHALQSSHDTPDPLIYIIRGQDRTLGIATDLGYVTDEILENFQNLDTLVLEFNHDKEMLIAGRYPAFLKRRILGDKGHLSNTQAAVFLSQVNHEKLKTVVLAHLSEHNNTPDLAMNAAIDAIKMGPGNPHIHVACQGKPSPVFEF
ncbi:MAG: MBL fold metallo-hydrolase [Deltaproteobacteria bacterium]|jgi:phosphoribosyl 1,2-cyclic phosphodiesterase|nr:MBL fold metallo-hydrolase [Deltaproteobacteria bacterium]